MPYGRARNSFWATYMRGRALRWRFQSKVLHDRDMVMAARVLARLSVAESGEANVGWYV
jgi:hypothetical protein